MNNKEREHRRIWTPQQDDALKEIHDSQGDTKMKWSQIASALSSKLNIQIPRTSKQCRERWTNLKAQTTIPWTNDDEIRLLKACKQYGHRWAKLAHEIGDGRSDNYLKNHFYSTLRRMVRWVNKFIKEKKKQLQSRDKIQNLQSLSQFSREFLKIRNFQIKHLTKVFSLIDPKQLSRFQPTESISSKEIKQINDQILQFLEFFVLDKVSDLSIDFIIEMIAKIMRVNRLAKTMYTKEIKLTLVQQEQIQKKKQQKKKYNKKIRKQVDSYLKQTKTEVIPDKKKRKQILQKIQEQKTKFRHKRAKIPKNKSSKGEDKSSNLNKSGLIESIPFSDCNPPASSFKFVENHLIQSKDYSEIDEKNPFGLPNLLARKNQPFFPEVKEVNPFEIQHALSQSQRCFEFPMIQNKPKQPSLSQSQSSFSSFHPNQEAGIFSSQNVEKNKEKLNYSLGLDDLRKSQGNLQNNNFSNINPTSPKEFFAQHPFPNKFENIGLLISRPLSNSMFFQESQQFNMFQSQPIILQRSMNYKEVNQPQPLYNSFQYVSSQETHSLNSKKEQ